MIIPLITTDAGSCLTIANWQAVGVHLISYHLTALLMKPGFDLLNELPNLSAYVGWPEAFVLNASMPKMDKSGLYTLRSIYDGSRSQYKIDTLFNLIGQLNPPFVILPEGVRNQNPDDWLSLPMGIFPFFSPIDMPDSKGTRPFGIHLPYNGISSFSSLLSLAAEYHEHTCYVSGELDASQLQALAQIGIRYLESDLPARDAIQGMVYHDEGTYSLKDESQTLQFNLIDSNCLCPTCSQGLTRAYLHHLLEHTPLLCQRFLVQHNIYYCQTSFTRA